jgi:peptidoglycan/LPS O-acetylase OafA/YrhL
VGETIGYTIVSMMFVLILIAAAGADAAGATGWTGPLRFRPLRAVGKYSYAMYVFHKPLHDYIGRPVVVALNVDAAHSVLLNAAYIVAGAIVTFAAAFVSWHLFEKYFLRMKRLFEAKS